MGLPWESDTGIKRKNGGVAPKAYSKRLITRENGYSIDLTGSNSAMGTFKNTKPLLYDQPKTPYDLLQQPTVLKSRDMNINKYVEKTKVSEWHAVNQKGRVFQLSRSGTRGEERKTRMKQAVPVVEPSVENHHYNSNNNSGNENEMVTFNGGSDNYSVTSEKSGSSSRSSSRSQKSRSNKPKVTTRKQSATRRKKPSYTSAKYEENTYEEFNNNVYNESPVEYEFYSSEARGDAFSQNSARSNTSSASTKRKTRKTSSTRKAKKTAVPPPQEHAPPTFSNAENPPEYDQGTVRVECDICGRKFNEDRIAKHRNVCSKSTTKKRKVFSTRAQRQEKEARKLQVHQVKEERKMKKTNVSHESKRVGKAIPKWKLQHMEFQKILKAGKGDEPSGSSYTMTAEEEAVMEQLDSRVPCPHCGRKFNENVADRHIPKCRNIINKPTTLKRRTQSRTLSSKAPRSSSRVGATTRATSNRSTSRNAPAAAAATPQTTYNKSRVQSSGYGRQSSVPKSTTRSRYRTSSNATSRYSSNLPSRYRT